MSKKFLRFDLVSYNVAKEFGRNQENRLIKHRHLNRIKQQCIESMEMMPPIKVNVTTNHIIDGQHRLKAFMDLIEDGTFSEDTKIKVEYVEIPAGAEEKEAIIKANTNTQNWTLEDYISSYARGGNNYYMMLDEWCKMHVLTNDNGTSKFRYGAAIITGKRCAKALELGTFSFTEDEYERANDVHAEMLEIVELFGMKGKGAWIESLATSWISARDQHEFRVWIRELKAKKSRFIKLPKDNSRDWDNIFAQAHLAIDKKNG